MSIPSLQERGECSGSGTGAGFSAICLRAKGQRKPGFPFLEACGGLGAAMVAGRVTACLGVAGGGNEGGGPLCDLLSENRPIGDHNASQNCSTEEKR
jgi:hypothetical protein